MNIPKVGDTVYIVNTHFPFDSEYRYFKSIVSKVQTRKTKNGLNVYVLVENRKYRLNYDGMSAYPQLKKGEYRRHYILSFDIVGAEKTIELLKFQRDLKNRLVGVQRYLNGFNIMEEKYLRMLEAVVSDLKNQELKVDA